MRIDKITFGKDTCIIIDGEIYYVDSDCLISHHLHEGDELAKHTLALFLKESETISCRKYLYLQIDKYAKTEKGYRDKLYEKGFSSHAIFSAMQSAKEKGYIDDTAFAMRYYERYSEKKGKKRIFSELRAKGVDKETLAFLYEAEDDFNAVYVLANKFMKKRDKSVEQKTKLFRHLASKGFSYDIISAVVDKIFNEID